MAVQLVERNIQWYGLIRPQLPDNVKWYRLSFDLTRRPPSEYLSAKTRPMRSFYGYVSTLKMGRVLSVHPLEFPSSLVVENSFDAYFLHLALSCHLEATLTSFINNGTWTRPGYPYQRNNPIKDWVPYRVIPDEFRIQLVSEPCQGKFRLEYDTQETCEVPESSPPPPPPPPPPSPLPPPSSPDAPLPFPNSPPYDGTDDNGQTYKPDVLPPPPERCTPVRVVVEITRPLAEGGTFLTEVDVYAPVADVEVACDVSGDVYSSSVNLLCAGKVSDGVCQIQGARVVVTGKSGGGDASQCYVSARVLSITPL